MIKLLLNDEELPFTTTIFPDGTSQVWKIKDIPDFDEDFDEIKILWLFENEAELMHVCQLVQLVEAELTNIDTLVVPYLPYGRQDKMISNSYSFALNTFMDILYNIGICRIETFDAHSRSTMVYSTSPEKFHDSITKNSDHNVICFPDLGASERYKYSFNIDNFTHITFEKVRNQGTGEITGLKLLGSTDLRGRNILIVDDICDGGMTFIKVAQALKQYEPNRIDLAVSHGLFSKAKQCLYDAGITNIYTTNSLLRNPDGFKVW